MMTSDTASQEGDGIDVQEKAGVELQQEEWRSYQCPTDSCRIPVIPVESGAFQRNENWQGALPIVSFLLFLVPAESLHSGVHTGMFPGMQPE